jgi:L-ascorbate metabolism protein UlaG (beta-lactamase superfamily)
MRPIRRFLARFLTAALLVLPAVVVAQDKQVDVSGEVAAKDGANAISRHMLVLPGGSGGAPATGEGSVIFIGTATVIIKHAGFTILTDPNFLHKGERAYLGHGLTSERLTDPAMELEALPPIDLIVLSHLHGDHFDQLVQQRLSREIPVVTTEEAAAQLDEMGFKARYALKTWDALTVKKGNAILRVTAMPARHGPPVVATMLPEVMGSMLDFFAEDGKRSYRMYISGDTVVYDGIREIPQRYPDVDLALLHLGGARILGSMTVTMDGKEGVRMLYIIAPKHAIPIHYDDYDVFKSPLSDFEKEVELAGLRGKITYLKHGEMYKFSPEKH